MNLLFITNSLYPKLNANSQIAYNIAEVLVEKYGCEITILGAGKLVQGKKYPGVNNIRQEVLYKNTELARILSQYEGLGKYIRIIISPSVWKNAIKRTLYGKEKFLLNRIKELNATYDVDGIVVFSNPTNVLKAMIRYNGNVPFISYKLDPWSTHYTNAENMLERVLEKQSDEKTGAIVVTDLIYDEYYKKNNFIYNQKVHIAEFPNLIDRSCYKIKNKKTGRVINCVFTGALYEDIRNPRYTFKLFSELAKYGVILNIYGPLYGDCIDNDLPQNVIYHGEVSSEDALSIVGEADVLVNIGNMICNQMPSKLITYIAYGKPILNIIKSAGCPTLKYTSKYPIALNLVEEDQISEEIINKTLTFLAKNVGKDLDFDRIKKIYPECTPEVVAGKLHRILCDITDSRK